MVPCDPRIRSPSPWRLLLKVDCQVTTRSLGKSRVTAIVSGTSRPSFSEKTPPDMYAPDGSCRSSARMIHAIWCTMFSVTFPPENSQYSRQLMNLNGSNGRFERPLRNESHFTLALVQSGGTGRPHGVFPRGVLRLIHDSTWVILPTRPCLIHSFESHNAPEL